jgi:hypothetical protein
MKLADSITQWTRHNTEVVDVCRAEDLQGQDCTRKRHSGLLVLDASQGEHHPPEGANVSIQILNFQFFLVTGMGLFL